MVIEGGNALHGEVTISGAKNAVLPIMAATLLCPEAVRITNVPNLDDVITLQRLLVGMGVNVQFNDGAIEIKADQIVDCFAPYDLVRKMRASILVLGPLLARCGEAKVALPGGCAIGARPIDQHISALQMLGADIRIEDGYVYARAERLRGAKIVFDMVTVTGTENMMMAAVLADGVTLLENAAREPEVTDLANFLNKMGAKISGIGSDCLQIEGVDSLHGCLYSVLPDRIETGTHLIAAAMTGGHITTLNTHAHLLESVLVKLKESGAFIESGDDFIRLDMRGHYLKAVNIRTAPFPAFPTDMQAQFMALNTIAKGSSMITETIFENRFMHVPELMRLGAQIDIEGNTAFVHGIRYLTAAPVMATDLRASACLVLAGLAAEGVTQIEGLHHLDRGYDGIEKKLSSLGAKIRRIAEQDDAS